MLSRWIKELPFSLVHLAFLLLWLYFSVYRPSWLSISGLVVVICLVVHHYKEDRSSLLRLALATLRPSLFFSEPRIIQNKSKVAPQPIYI